MARAKPTKEAFQPPQKLQRLDRLDTAVVRDTAGFASLKEEWDELYRSCPSATPFQSWEWLYSWWEHYGEAYNLRLITIRDAEGLLAGIVPLMVRRRPSFGRLLLLGGDKITLYSDVMTPYKDILVREGWEEPAARAGARAIEELDGWKVADLQELMPESAAWLIFRYWDGPKTRVPITDYILMQANCSWEELLSSLSRKLRKTARRTLRQAEQDGLKCKSAAPQDAGRAARALVKLHRELWRGRRVAPDHLTPRYEAFMEVAARRMSARGIGRISEFRRQGGKVVFSQFLVFDKDFVGIYVIGASEEASRRYQLETLSNWDAIDVAYGGSREYVSFMDGASRDKLRWATKVVASERMILGRSLAYWIPYASYYVVPDRYQTVRSKVQVYVYSEDAPRWVKNAVDRYYALLDYLHSDNTPQLVTQAVKSYYALRAKYGYGWLRYCLELAQMHRQIRKSTVNEMK